MAHALPGVCHARGKTRFKLAPAANMLESKVGQWQQACDDQEKLQNFVIDCAGQSTEKDVSQNHQCGGNDGEMKDVSRWDMQACENRIEEVQGSDQLGHRIDRNAGRED